MTFTNLIRFKDCMGNIHLGDVPIDANGTIDLIGRSASILKGDTFNETVPTGETAIIHKILSPLKSVPLILCIGLNYAEHAKEAKLPIPVSPVLFIKPSDCLSGPFDSIEIPSHARLLDYEGELCIVMKKTGKDIPEESADDYILGYTIGNDVSSRYWQRPPHSGGQYCYAKGFDSFAPIGPTIRSVTQTDTGGMKLTTWVNGEERQCAPTSDMIFSPRQIVAHLSKGCTLRQGTLIMTGTPDGIAGRLPDTPWLKPGDIVRVAIPGIGHIENRFSSDSNPAKI